MWDVVILLKVPGQKNHETIYWKTKCFFKSQGVTECNIETHTQLCLQCKVSSFFWAATNACTARYSVLGLKTRQLEVISEVKRANLQTAHTSQNTLPNMQLKLSNSLVKPLISFASCSAYGTFWSESPRLAASDFFFNNLDAMSRPFAKGVSGSSVFALRFSLVPLAFGYPALRQQQTQE